MQQKKVSKKIDYFYYTQENELSENRKKRFPLICEQIIIMDLKQLGKEKLI